MSVILLVLAAACFFFAAINQTILHQPPADLVAWGLFGVAVAILLGQPLVVKHLNRGE